MTKLVIVESPTKAKTIRNFLPKEYKVEASMGHVRDLPASAGEIPAGVKKEAWARLGVNVEQDFDPLYVIPASKKKVVAQLRALLKDADELILATDEDREGESIGWHLFEVLKPKVPVTRMVFHEITKEAIQAALKETRQIDTNLVKAQEARRIVDRLVGYTVSPLLWKKIAPKLSAGRVQSVAVRLLVQRERERRAFRTGSYWDLKALLNKRPDKADHRFEAQLVSVGGVRVASGRDFDEHTGKIAEGKEVLLLNEAQTQALRTRLLAGLWRVTAVETRDATRAPSPPFTTSTMQQEANRKLGMGAKQAMQTAQKLYENGFITYMRTDSVNLSDQAVNAARNRVTELYGAEYLHPQPRRYTTKAKGAQEAHEAIRPAGDQMLPAEQQPLSGNEKALYDLIWKRTVATQMANAQLKFSTVTIEVEDAAFKASGRQVVFPGFFRAYVEGSDDPEAALENQDSLLPELSVDEEVDCRELDPIGHETKPPARYTEASLVKALEAEGIGRPSTYATIIDTIQERGYVFKQRKELVPTFTAFATTVLLEEHFSNLVDFGFTAEMEQKLDDIAAGEQGWLEFLRAFYLGKDGLENRVKEKENSIEARDASRVDFADLPAEVRIGQFGPFIARGENGDRVTAGLPADIPPADLNAELVETLLTQKADGPQVVGQDPETGLDILIKIGPYGPYVQLGENDDAKGKAKPKRASLLKGMEVADVDLPLALKLLSLPRTLGEHPEDGAPVQASVGRFGPYVVHAGKYVSLKAPDHVLEVDLKRALELIAAAPAKKGRSAKAVLKELGVHPEDNAPVNVLDGRYGPYVNHGKINATLPKEIKPEEVTLAQALGWIAEKAAQKGVKGKAKAKPKAKAKAKPKAKTTAKKTTTKAKTTAKAKPAAKAKP
ncbi:MAG: type I DNA topoisomerase, partial [Caldilineaceae bacterium]|nr:type I DNA topoisomerase [Caldilineaceae bacterium]MBP8109439.1 type I DNA topoisomerase [Caldilineaceae bacterium]MBP8124694.1 type I DNA topoisomerase [Caldilineaceae bacterium]MBP9071690.1 type I DNA topoisomerase [Caldilineaceae bacterium]